jgi:chromosome segregation ATPase
MAVLSSYPSADQLPEALKGIETARKGMDKDTDARSAAYEDAIARLKTDTGQTAAKLGDENRQLAARLDAADKGRVLAEGRLADSERSLKASQDQIAELQVQLAAAQAATAKASVQSGSISPQDAAAATGDAKDLAQLKAQVEALKGQYASYVAAESATAGRTGDAVLIERKKRLVALFGSGEFKTVFPELERLVDSQMSSWQQQMSLATLRTAADIAIQATKAKPGKERQSSLDANAKHYSGDPTLVGFIDALRGLLK